MVRVGDARAVVAVEEQPVRRRFSTRRSIFFSQALYGVLTFVTGGTRLSWLSFPANLQQVGDVIFRLPPLYDTPWPVSFLMVAALIAVSALVLERRVRGVEVVA